MTGSHTEEKARAVWDSLTRAGIGRTYHRRSIAEVGSEALDEWVRSPLASLRQGEGWTFIGTTEAYDAALLTARGLHIHGHGALVLPLHRLARWVDTEHELDRVYNVKSLFVTGFYETVHTPPLTGWQVQGIEEVLEERLDANRSVFIQMEKPFDAEAWWTPRLRERLDNINRSLTL